VVQQLAEKVWNARSLFDPELTFNVITDLVKLTAPALAGLLIYSHLDRAARLLARAKRAKDG
jgi:hypothetical protein